MGKTNRLLLNEEEEIVLKGQVTFKFNPRSGWRPDHLFLTDKKFILAQSNGIKCEIPIEDITVLKVTDGGYVLRKKKFISLSYKSTIAEKASNVAIIVSGTMKKDSK